MKERDRGAVQPLQPPLQPRRGDCVQVLGIARISRTTQDERSLEDQEALYRNFLDGRCEHPYDLRMIAGQGSGEHLERGDYLRIWAEVESGRYDLVISEDLARIARRVHTQLLCECCEDLGTRLIALNDHLDTAQENWRVLAGIATIRHEMYNADTAKRIRRTHRNRFLLGQVVQCLPYGFLMRPEGTSDADVHVDEEARPIILEMFRRLECGDSFAGVSDWLNERGVPVGRYCRSKGWTAGMVAQYVRNELLKGVRVRNRRMNKRSNRDGRRRPVKAPPSERLERFCPHLVIIEPAWYDRVIQLLRERNSLNRRKGAAAGEDPRLGVPKRRTVWPGQHLACGVCGRTMRYGAHGQLQNLFCLGAYQYRCWNAVSVNGPLAARKLAEAVLREIEELPDFDEALLAALLAARAQEAGGREDRQRAVAARLAQLERERDNLVGSLRMTGPSEAIARELAGVERQLTSAREELAVLDENVTELSELPCAETLRQLAREAMQALAAGSPEFGRLMRQWVPKIHVLPVRLRQGGKPQPRAYLTLELAPLISKKAFRSVLGGVLRREMVVDLFEPPGRERHRSDVVRLAAEGRTGREIAAALGTHLPTIQRALQLQREMDRLGVTDSYESLTEPPADDTKWRRHRRSRYHFVPLPGFPLNPPHSG